MCHKNACATDRHGHSVNCNDSPDGDGMYSLIIGAIEHSNPTYDVAKKDSFAYFEDYANDL